MQLCYTERFARSYAAAPAAIRRAFDRQVPRFAARRS